MSGMTITEFLLARIAEDEKAARRWHSAEGVTANADDRSTWWQRGHVRLYDFDEVIARGWVVEAEPNRRQLAECEAKRRIVEEGGSECSGYSDPINAEVAANIGMPEWLHYPDPNWTGHCDGCSAAQSADADRLRVLSLLATVYADHPDYREEWRP